MIFKIFIMFFFKVRPNSDDNIHADMHTIGLGKAIRDALKIKFGLTPYMVYTNVHRKA